MNNIKISRRVYILIGLSLMVFSIYSFQLFKIQILDKDKYVFLSNMMNHRSQAIKASRGIIEDRNGIVIASNKSGFDVALNKALINPDEEYKTILDVANLLNRYRIEIVDELPIIIKSGKIYFKKNEKYSINTLKKFLELDSKSQLTDVWKQLVKKYKLQNYSLQQAKTIAGVKYTMALKGYSYSLPYIISRNIPIDILIDFQENSYQIKGVEIIENPSRDYLLKDCAPHIIGNVGPIYAEEYAKLKDENYKFNDFIGKSGIEKYCERYLRGIDGEKIVKLNNNGRVNKIYNRSEPTPGNTVVLTIDSKLQYVAQQALENQIHKLNATASPGQGREADAGSVVVIDVATGEVLAMASYPSYNIDEYNKNFSVLLNDAKKPLFNRSLLGTYAPGSCYKPVVGVAALQERIAQPKSTVHCGHVYNYFEDYRPRCLGYHGNINVMDAIKYSCNIYFYDVGRILGIDRINKYSKQFGFASHTGIQLLENVGQLASPKLRNSLGMKWYPGDVLQASIGQSDNLATPLQFANYAATLANRGKRMDVSIIKKIISYDKKNVIYEHVPTVKCNVTASKEAFETVIEGMSRASRSGTARKYFGSYPITVPSKTGTPETSKLCNSTFVCFAPNKESKIAIAVVIEKGWHGYTGAPVAKEILNSYFGFAQ